MITRRVFLAYSREDGVFRRQLDAHLAPLKREGLVEIWHDRQLLVGANWRVAIEDELSTADVIVLLISPDFINSDYCYNVEMRRALDLHRTGRVSVIPIIVRPCDWNSLPFSHLQVLPSNVKPVSSWSKRDGAWHDVVREIRRLLIHQGTSASDGKDTDQTALTDDRPVLLQSQRGVTAQDFRRLCEAPNAWGLTNHSKSRIDLVPIRDDWEPEIISAVKRYFGNYVDSISNIMCVAEDSGSVNLRISAAALSPILLKVNKRVGDKRALNAITRLSVRAPAG